MRRRGVPFAHVETGPVVGAGPLGAPLSVARIAVGTLAIAARILRDRPDVVFVTGGFVSVPAAVAARLMGVRLAMYLPDARPGRAASFIARLADRIFVTHADAALHVGARKAVVTGYPVRAGLRDRDRGGARRSAGATGARPLILVFGGSQGALHLNTALAEAAPEVLQNADVIHVSGDRDFDAARARAADLPSDLAAAYRLEPYLHDEAMLDALAAADLAISRAGAAVLGEYPARGLPSILVPLPISRGHQWDNARVLETAGAAVIVPDDALTGARLAAEVARIFGQPGLLDGMRRAAGSLDRPGAAEAIASGLLSLADRARSAA